MASSHDRLPDSTNNNLLKQKKVEIPFDHLSEGVRYFIAGVGQQRSRMHRVQGGAAAITLAIAGPNNIFGILAGSIATQSFLHREKIQNAHKDLVKQLNRGVIAPEYQLDYPKGWMSSSTVSITHPIFYVKLNGNLVFVRETRGEYLRYKAQEQPLVRGIGVHPWLWRSYLRPPKVSKKVKEWVKRKLLELRGRIPKPRLSPGWRPRPAFAPARIMMRRAKRRPNH